MIRTSVLVMMASGLNSLLGFFFWIVAAQKFTDNEVGLAGAAVPAFSLAALITSAGAIPTLLVLVARKEFPKPLAIKSSAFLGLITGVVAWIILQVSSGDVAELRSDNAMLWLVIIGAALTAFTGCVDSIFISSRRPGLMVIRNFIMAAGKLVALMLVRDGDARTIVTTWVIFLGFSALMGIYAVSLLDDGRNLPADIRNIWFANHLGAIGGQIPTFILPLVVASQLGASVNAKFYMAWLIAGAFFLISPAVATSLISEVSRDAEHTKNHVLHATRLAFGLVIPTTVVVAIFAEPILGVFGPQYRDAKMILIILLISAYPDTVTNLAIGVLRATNRASQAAWLNITMAGIAITMAISTAQFGVKWVAGSWLVAQSFGTLIVAIAVLKNRNTTQNSTVSNFN